MVVERQPFSNFPAPVIEPALPAPIRPAWTLNSWSNRNICRWWNWCAGSNPAKSGGGGGGGGAQQAGPGGDGVNLAPVVEEVEFENTTAVGGFGGKGICHHQIIPLIDTSLNSKYIIDLNTL